MQNKCRLNIKKEIIILKTSMKLGHLYMNEAGKEFNEDMEVVCEEFKVVFKI